MKLYGSCVRDEARARESLLILNSGATLTSEIIVLIYLNNDIEFLLNIMNINIFNNLNEIEDILIKTESKNLDKNPFLTYDWINTYWDIYIWEK